MAIVEGASSLAVVCLRRRARAFRSLTEGAIAGLRASTLRFAINLPFFENEVDRLQLPPEISSSPHRCNRVGCAGKIKQEKKRIVSSLSLALVAGQGEERNARQCSPKRPVLPSSCLRSGTYSRPPRQERGQARGSVRLDEASPWGRLAPSATPPSERNCPRMLNSSPSPSPISESVEIFARKKKKDKKKKSFRIITGTGEQSARARSIGLALWPGSLADKTDAPNVGLGVVGYGAPSKKGAAFLRNS